MANTNTLVDAYISTSADFAKLFALQSFGLSKGLVILLTIALRK